MRLWLCVLTNCDGAIDGVLGVGLDDVRRPFHIDVNHVLLHFRVLWQQKMSSLGVSIRMSLYHWIKIHWTNTCMALCVAMTAWRVVMTSLTTAVGNGAEVSGHRSSNHQRQDDQSGWDLIHDYQSCCGIAQSEPTRSHATLVSLTGDINTCCLNKMKTPIALNLYVSRSCTSSHCYPTVTAQLSPGSEHDARTLKRWTLWWHVRP